jgi:DNA helicase-2/ATP-dependent DNA helicase PcrA
LDHAALATNRPDEDDSGAVRLMTLHKAKGLEFPHVFLPAWEEKIMPSDYGDADEERRLAYVAITRGMRRVTISYSGFRRGAAFPSLFLKDIPEECAVKGWLRDQRKTREVQTLPERKTGDWKTRAWNA